MPSRIYGTVFGILNGWAMLGAVVAPAVTGRLRDAGGSFASSCFLAAALAALGALLVAAVRPAFRAGPEVAWDEGDAPRAAMTNIERRMSNGEGGNLRHS